MASSIQIFLFGDLGDAVLTTPALRAVRSQYSGARIQLVAKPAIGSFLRDLSLVDEVIAVDKSAFDRPLSVLSPGNLWKLIHLTYRLRTSRPDMLIIFHHLVSRWGTIKFGALALAGGAPRRVGLDNGRGWFLTDRVPDRGFGAVHELEYWLLVANSAGAGERPTLHIPIREVDVETVDRLLPARAVQGPDLIAIHPGTGEYGPGRRWPGVSFAQAALKIADHRDVHFVVVGTEVDADAAVSVKAALGSRATDLTGRTSIGELAALLERCRLTIANDGGVGHVSAAVGTPVVSIFGPSNDSAWRPLLGKVVRADLPCRPCFYRDHSTGDRMGCASRECLSLVRPEDVARAAIELIGETRVA